jgi:hypothetical protein
MTSKLVSSLKEDLTSKSMAARFFPTHPPPASQPEVKPPLAPAPAAAEDTMQSFSLDAEHQDPLPQSQNGQETGEQEHHPHAPFIQHDLPLLQLSQPDKSMDPPNGTTLCVMQKMLTAVQAVQEELTGLHLAVQENNRRSAETNAFLKKSFDEHGQNLDHAQKDFKVITSGFLNDLTPQITRLLSEQQTALSAFADTVRKSKKRSLEEDSAVPSDRSKQSTAASAAAASPKPSEDSSEQAPKRLKSKKDSKPKGEKKKKNKHKETEQQMQQAIDDQSLPLVYRTAPSSTSSTSKFEY